MRFTFFLPAGNVMQDFPELRVRAPHPPCFHNMLEVFFPFRYAEQRYEFFNIRGGHIKNEIRVAAGNAGVYGQTILFRLIAQLLAQYECNVAMRTIP